MTSRVSGLGLLARAVGYTLASAGHATPDLFMRATPCAGWDLTMLIGHVSDSLDVLNDALVAGQVRPGPAVRPGAPDGVHAVRALRRRAGTLLAACVAQQDGGRAVTIADRRLPADVVALTGALEISVHAWDIAAACGRHAPIPPRLASEMLTVAPALIPAGMREGLFAEPVPVAAASCPSDRLIAFLGRHPGWPSRP